MLKIDTSLFDPIKIEINGQVYPVIRITAPIEREMLELDKAYLSGDLLASRRRLTLLLGEHPELENLDVSEVTRIFKDIIQRAYIPGKKDEEDSKNAVAPGASQ